MADAVVQKRRLPPRERRESAAKRRASSPVRTVPPSTPVVVKQPSTPAAVSEPRQKRAYTKRGTKVKTQAPVSRSSPSLSIDEDVLPTKVAADKPLPTTQQKQTLDLSLKEYQSIAESAILATSVHRSRMQWLCNGILEKYWVKPFKRKGVVQQPPNNPDVKTMHKLGGAAITIEPHSFDAVFYTVRDPTITQPVYPRHPNQHTPRAMLPQPSQAQPQVQHPAPPSSYNKMYPPQVPYPRPASNPPTVARPLPASAAPSAGPTPTSSPTPAPHVAHQSLPPPTPVTPGASPGASQPVKQEPVVARPVAAISQPLVPTTPANQPPRQPPPAPSHEKPNTPSGGGGKGSTTDPVIQMLAARAATDSRLKDLMKVVATSKASPEQLKEFQAHIDEFNEVIRKQGAERAKAESRPVSKSPGTPVGPPQVSGSGEKTPEFKGATPQPSRPVPAPSAAVGTPAPGATHPSTYKAAVPPQARQALHPAGAAALPGVVHTFPPPQTGPARPMSGYMGYAPPPPRAEPIIKHIVLEITSTPSATQSACQDRWLFPKHAVLEIRPSGLEMLCSFLVERKGSDILANIGGNDEMAEETGASNPSKFSAEKEYYQAVTMSIKVMQHKTIATIAQAAKPLTAVQEYMKEVMEKKERAPVEYLVHQLPREAGSVGGEGADGAFVDSGVELCSESEQEEDELKEYYGI